MFYWVKLRSGKWVIAEKRYLNRWFICGVAAIMYPIVCDNLHRTKNSCDIMEVGEQVICPYEDESKEQ